MRKKQIAIITLFIIVITYLGSYFQWVEFYEGYGFDIDIPTLILITSPLGMLFNFIGYWLGERATKTR
ncbi:MAG: hypothetical protein ABRQ27_08395 [Clostridiaceae bacterium]